MPFGSMTPAKRAVTRVKGRRELVPPSRAVKFQDLARDFLARMQRLGNSGTDCGVKDGLFRKVRGWSLTYGTGDRWRQIPIRVDGRVPEFRSEGYVPVDDGDFEPSKDQLATLAKSMAEVPRRHGG